MVDRNRKLNETAKALGVSPRVLQQYFSLKTAEVTPQKVKPKVVPTRRLTSARKQTKA